MWTNLQGLLDKGPIANEFTKYFLYQILVRSSLFSYQSEKTKRNSEA